MSIIKGWGLTARLVAAHFGALGEKLAGALASFDPETATAADRDNLAERLRESAKLLATSRAEFNKEHDDVVKLEALIASDEAALIKLAEKLEKDEIKESTVNMFCDELEQNKARLSVEIEEEQYAKEVMTEVQKIVDGISEQLASFDARAKKALAQLKIAETQKNLQEMRIDRQEELAGLSSLRSHSTALDALTKKAVKMNNEAEGLKIIGDINQKPIDERAELDAIRKSVASENAGESAMDRIKRLSKKNAEVAV